MGPDAPVTRTGVSAIGVVFRRLFSGFQGDLDALNRVNDSVWCRALHSGSVLGIANDFNLMSYPEDNILAQGPPDSAINFIHGGDDTFTSVAQLRAHLQERPSAQLHVIGNAGQFTAASHSRIWDLVAVLMETPAVHGPASSNTIGAFS